MRRFQYRLGTLLVLMLVVQIACIVVPIVVKTYWHNTEKRRDWLDEEKQIRLKLMSRYLERAKKGECAYSPDPIGVEF